MNPKTIFVTGISTEVGKTIASAIIVEALQADYWKPIQAGELQNCDTQKVKSLISNNKTSFFANAYALEYPASPHWSAQKQHITISVSEINRPYTHNTLVIEGAGGVWVPLNASDTMMDLMQNTDKIIVVSRHYLGSINHTMLTIEALLRKGLEVCGIIFSGDENPSTESWISDYTHIPIIGRIHQESYFDKKKIQQYATDFKQKLQEVIF